MVVEIILLFQSWSKILASILVLAKPSISSLLASISIL